MNILTTRPMPPFLKAPALLFFATTFFISCSSESGDRTPPEDPGTPPSLSEGRSQALITLSEQQAENLNIQTHTVEEEAVSFSIEAPGQVFASPEHIAVVSAPINGRVINISAHEGERVKKGDPLLVLESLEFANLVAAYLEATAEITYQQQQVERLKVLSEEKITPQRTLERAQADLMLARTKQSAAHSRLRAVGLSDQTIKTLDSESDEDHARLTMYAQLAGTINEHRVDLGQSVNAYEKLLDIIDNKQVLVRGFVSPGDAPFLQPGSRVVITEKADGTSPQNQRLEATITTVNPALDATNKSIILNSLVDTQNGWPIVGQNVRLQYAARASDAAISIPLSAIQFEESEATVFIRISPREYQKRTVNIQRMTPEYAIIESGLKPGDAIAVSQVFSLKALERFEQFSE